MKNNSKYLYLIAGANGSGKSTLASELIPEEKLEFLNADEIAKEICPENISSVSISAGKEFYKRLDSCFDQGISFAIETTLSGKNHIKTISRAKAFGYKVILIYISVDTPDLCINRIKVRVEKGGHYVPDEDVIRRFYRCRENFWNKYKDLVDDWAVFYNGAIQFTLLHKSNKVKGISKLTKIGNRAVKKAQEENRFLGLPNVYCVHGETVFR
ncbi:MAG: zeta toxin family protein [Candidatus Gastranaerophilales bacterium]|nr:zeta toxin family protein [Candidatus Gastranaerophilales bacterium]